MSKRLNKIERSIEDCKPNYFRAVLFAIGIVAGVLLLIYAIKM